MNKYSSRGEDYFASTMTAALRQLIREIKPSASEATIHISLTQKNVKKAEPRFKVGEAVIIKTALRHGDWLKELYGSTELTIVEATPRYGEAIYKVEDKDSGRNNSNVPESYLQLLDDAVANHIAEGGY